MYDFIKANIIEAVQDERKFFQEIDFARPVVGNTGEYESQSKWNYSENSIKLSYHDKEDRPLKRIELAGSIHKHFQHGCNYEDFSHTALFKSVFSICERYHLNPHKMALENIEIGVNIMTSFDPTTLLENAFCVGTSLFTDMKNKHHHKIGAECVSGCRRKLYHKGKQLHNIIELPYNLARYELHFNRMRTPQRVAGIYSMSDLLNPLKYQRMANYLWKSLDDIVFINQMPRTRPLGVSDRNLLANWSNPYFITDRMRHAPQMFRRERRRYLELTSNNPENQSYEFTKLVRSKINEMSQFDRKTLKQVRTYLNSFDSQIWQFEKH